MTSKNNDFYFLPLGGTGEIGMNLNLYGHKGKWLMVDLGVTFGEYNFPGIDVIMPDITFIEEHKDDLVGLVLTHGHEDHIGAVPYLWEKLRCPIFATPFTAALLRRKFHDDRIEGADFIQEIPLSGSFLLDPFDIELVTLTHSIPEPNAVIIRTPQGPIVHTGDWKFDPDPLVGDDYDLQRLHEISSENVLALVCDSTNALKEGASGSELDVREALDPVIEKCENRVVVACFASNVARLETVFYLAEKHNRQICLVGRSMYRIYEAARETGYLTDVMPPIDIDRANQLRREDVLYLCTGSQGESRAALWRIANNDHPSVFLDAGDTVIFSSRVIPGNEKGIFALYNMLAKKEIDVITDEQNPLIHVSGHPYRDELVRMYQVIKPKVAIPVHGEARHLLGHAELAEECQVQQALICENGHLIRFQDGKAELIDKVHAGKLALDGGKLRPINSEILRHRRRMALNGHAVVTLVFDGKGALLQDPVILADGLYDAEEEAFITEEVVEAIRAAHTRLPKKKITQEDVVCEAARLAARKTFMRILGKKPLVQVQAVHL